LADTWTANLKLPIPATGDSGWNVANDARATILDGLTTAGSLAVTTHEQPSVSLLVDISAGSYQQQDGTIGTYAGVVSRAVTTAITNYLYLDLTSSGALVVGTSFPSTAHVRLALVVAGATTISSISDQRVAFQVIGSVLDGTEWALGTSSGLQIGTATSQKLGFFGKTPIVQPTIGSGPASSSWTSVEQAMLQAVFNAVRALGLGS
jgi:hypothetical protein